MKKKSIRGLLLLLLPIIVSGFITPTKFSKSPIYSNFSVPATPSSPSVEKDVVEPKPNKRTRAKRLAVNTWKKMNAAPLLPVLLAFGTGYQFGTNSNRATYLTKQTLDTSSRVITKTRPPYLLTGIITLIALREVWNFIPAWLKRQIPYVGRKYSKQAGKEDPDDMTSIVSISAKLQALMKTVQERLDSRVQLPENSQPAFLALLKLNSQLRQEFGENRDARYDSAGEVVQDPKEVMEGLDEAFEFADWAYDELPDEKTLKEAFEELGFYLLRHDKIALPGSVSHYVAISKERKLAVIGVKGTSTFEDLLTDMCGQAVSHELEGPFVPGGPTEIRCHEGVILASRRLADDLTTLLEEFILPRGYSVLLTGHSLGAGVACLCSLILRSRFPSLLNDSDGTILKVLAFASPPVLDYDAALASKPFVTVIVNNSDMIPRSSLSNLLVTAEFIKSVGKKLEEKGLTPKDLKSTAAFMQMLKGDDEMFMDVEEIREEMNAINDRTELRDPDHLYCPGRVIQMYDLWSKDGSREAEEEIEKETPPLTDESVEQAVEDLRTAERAHVTDGTSKVLRYIEVDSRMVNDHLSPAYRSSIKALLSNTKVPRPSLFEQKE
jgi:pimeloyl-ACP methyl ester carboxylesterase